MVILEFTPSEANLLFNGNIVFRNRSTFSPSLSPSPVGRQAPEVRHRERLRGQRGQVLPARLPRQPAQRKPGQGTVLHLRRKQGRSVPRGNREKVRDTRREQRKCPNSCFQGEYREKDIK